MLRNCAMEYVTSIVPETIGVLGPERGGHLAGAGGAAWSGCTLSTRWLRCLGGVGKRRRSGFSPKRFARLARGQGDDAELQVEGSSATVRRASWRLMAEREALSPASVRCLERIVGGGGACA